MCTIAAASLALAGVSGVTGFAAQQQQADAQAAQAAYEERALRANARAARENATREEENARRLDLDARTAEQEAIRQELRMQDQLKGLTEEQRQTFAANNIVTDSKSAGAHIRKTEELGRADILTHRQNAARQAFGIRQNADDLRFNAHQMRQQGSLMTQQAGYYNNLSNQSNFWGNAASLTSGLTSVMKVGRQNKSDGLNFWGFAK